MKRKPKQLELFPELTEAQSSERINVADEIQGSMTAFTLVVLGAVGVILLTLALVIF